MDEFLIGFFAALAALIGLICVALHYDLLSGVQVMAFIAIGVLAAIAGARL
jgi:hypothetical protein